MAVDLVGIQTVEHLNRIFQLTNHDFAVSSAVSALKRSGHARFRRGPSSDPLAPSGSSQFEEKLPKKTPPVESTAASNECSLKKSVAGTTSSFRSTGSSLVSSLAGEGLEGSVSNGRQLSSLGIVAPAPAFSSRKPPLPSSHRKRCSTNRPAASLQGSGRGNHSVSRTACHCCKRRKTGSKRESRRIPIIGSKVESIPADEYSWKKYGEKKVDGLPYPRVYYKCNSAKGCPARKRVELALNDSKMLLVTYDGEHRHHHAPAPVPISLTGIAIQSK